MNALLCLLYQLNRCTWMKICTLAHFKCSSLESGVVHVQYISYSKNITSCLKMQLRIRRAKNAAQTQFVCLTRNQRDSSYDSSMCVLYTHWHTVFPNDNPFSFTALWKSLFVCCNPLFLLLCFPFYIIHCFSSSVLSVCCLSLSLTLIVSRILSHAISVCQWVSGLEQQCSPQITCHQAGALRTQAPCFTSYSMFTSVQRSRL